MEFGVGVWMKVKEHSLTFDCKVASILAGSGLDTIHHVEGLFEECKGFAGRGNRYRQLSVPDFISFLMRKVGLFDCLKVHFETAYTCTICKWVSLRPSQESILQLYFPESSQHTFFTFQDLIAYNSGSILTGSNRVNCGKYGHTTSQTLSRSYESTPFIVEVVPVSTVKGRKRKNNAQVKLPLNKISLPGSSIDFQPITTIHPWRY